MTPESEQAMVVSLASIDATLKAVKDNQEEHSKAIEAVNYTLNGNGVPGLKQTVALHDEAIANFKRLFWLVLTPVIAAVGSGVVAATVYLIRQIH